MTRVNNIQYSAHLKLFYCMTCCIVILQFQHELPLAVIQKRAM